MRLIGLAVVLAVSLILAAVAGEAQTGRTYRVAYVAAPSTLSSDTAVSYFQTFRTAMRDLGYVEGDNLILDARTADRELASVPALVDEVIALKPDVLVGWESIAQVMRTKTTSIPIVLAGGIDPVRAGLAQSLRRPGMNVTGSVQLNDQLATKHIEIMREILPRLARVGVFVDTTASGCKAIQEQADQAARKFGAVLTPYYVANRGEIERAFSRMEGCPSRMLGTHGAFATCRRCRPL